MAGLSLSGAGEFAEILQVTPRHSRVTPLTLSPIATSTAVQAPTAEQTSRPGQTLGAGQAYGTGQTDARETKAAIEKLLALSGQKIDVRETKAAIENFFALPKQSADAGGAIAKTKRSFALSENNFSAQDARPLGSIDHNGNEDATQNSSPLLFWAIPIGIGVFVTFVAKIFGQKRQTDDPPLDYNY